MLVPTFAQVLQSIKDDIDGGVYPSTVSCFAGTEGACGRCGRKLTVPGSIASGIGPTCAEKGS